MCGSYYHLNKLPCVAVIIICRHCVEVIKIIMESFISSTVNPPPRTELFRQLFLRLAQFRLSPTNENFTTLFAYKLPTNLVSFLYLKAGGLSFCFNIYVYLIVETIIFQEVSLDKKCLVKLILPSSFETGLVLVIWLSTKIWTILNFCLKAQFSEGSYCKEWASLWCDL